MPRYTSRREITMSNLRREVTSTEDVLSLILSVLHKKGFYQYYTVTDTEPWIGSSSSCLIREDFTGTAAKLLVIPDSLALKDLEDVYRYVSVAYNASCEKLATYLLQI